MQCLGLLGCGVFFMNPATNMIYSNPSDLLMNPVVAGSWHGVRCSQWRASQVKEKPF